jgi:hypothetical protein
MNNINNDTAFSLNKFRKIKDNAYNSKESCTKMAKKWGKEYQTNPRFSEPIFDHVHFHAGDEKDINKYGLLPLRYFYSENKIKDKKTDKKTKIPKIFKLYKNIDYISIKNTFDYMFTKFKKGIFIMIRNNKLLVFLPFSNNNYKNNWYKQTYFSEEEKKLLHNKDYKDIKHILNKNIIEFQNKHPEQFSGKRKIMFNRDEWVGNNCFFRNLSPEYEGELVNSIFKNMLEELLKDRKIPDVEFFINNREFPLLKKDYTEPYEHLFDGNNIKIEKEYQFKKMAPIFSKSIKSDFADLLIPVQDDWYYASNKFFTDGCIDSYTKDSLKNLNTDWTKKMDIAIFRGSATGCGITTETNMRLRAAEISKKYPSILNAGITDWNMRLKKYKGMPIDIIDPQKLSFKLANKIDNIEKSNYKYILNIDGHVSAFRLSFELAMNSVILLVKSPWKIWYSNMLKEYIHYVPISEDLSDLITQIEWCKKNDKECKKIAKNALDFFNTYINKKGIFDYLEKELNMIYHNKNFKNLLGIKDVNKKTKNIAIISCFRDKGNGERERQHKLFIKLMNQLLEPYANFHIYIIEQSMDGEDFNIGKLKNIGYSIAKRDKKYDNYIFTDIDLIPDYKLLNYFIKNIDYPLSLASKGTRYENLNTKIKKPFMGGMLLFNEKLFEKINGYPNNFWGWGGEDDSLLNRIINNHIKYIAYPKEGIVIDNEEGKNMVTINDVKIKIKDERKDSLKYEKLFIDLERSHDNGLNTLQYNILSTDKINNNTTQIKVDLIKSEDEKKYKYLFPMPNNNYKKISTEVRKLWKNIKIKYI